MSDEREYDERLVLIQRELQEARNALRKLKRPYIKPAVLTQQPLYCSFCGKGSKEVSKLIAGPAVFICNECLALAAEILGKN